ncbi:MAG: hypothetical protein ACFE0O_15470 [Opitutales bacterium]
MNPCFRLFASLSLGILIPLGHLFGTITHNDDVRINHNHQIGAVHGDDIGLRLVSGDGGGAISGQDISHSIFFRMGIDGLKDTMNFYEYGDYRFYNDGLLQDQVLRLIIKQDGKVGIGTANPSELLQIKGNFLAENGASDVGTVRNAGVHVWHDKAFGMELHYDGDVSEWGTGIFTRFDSEIRFGHYPGNDETSQSTFSTRMVITDSGNVGIGTKTPTNLLEVNGVIRTREIVVEAQNWPDYVFDSEFQLPSAADIKAFYAEKGHLPSLPSRADLQANGASIGSIQRGMVEHIEILTRLLVEQDERLKQLEASNAQLLQKVNNQ